MFYMPTECLIRSRAWCPKDGIEKHGRKHQQGDNVYKSMERTSLEIRVKLSKISSPSVILYDACWCAAVPGVAKNRTRLSELN